MKRCQDRQSRIASLSFLILREQTLPKAGYILKLCLCSAHMPDKSLSVVAGIYQCNPAIPWHDRIHPLQECLSPSLLPKTLGFKVLKAHLAAHIFLLDMLEYVAVIITYPQADRHLCGYGHCVVRDILSRRHTAYGSTGLIEPN